MADHNLCLRGGQRDLTGNSGFQRIISRSSQQLITFFTYYMAYDVQMAEVADDILDEVNKYHVIAQRRRLRPCARAGTEALSACAQPGARFPNAQESINVSLLLSLPVRRLVENMRTAMFDRLRRRFDIQARLQ